ncbi:MAG: hypothetical protein ACOYJE_00620 [Bacteroidaceae bacterium]
MPQMKDYSRKTPTHRPDFSEERDRKPRTERISVLLTEEEKCLIDRFLESRRIQNRSHWIRRVVLGAVQEGASESSLLFSEHEMRR